jgi:hypothetical protein
MMKIWNKNPGLVFYLKNPGSLCPWIFFFKLIIWNIDIHTCLLDLILLPVTLTTIFIFNYAYITIFTTSSYPHRNCYFVYMKFNLNNVHYRAILKNPGSLCPWIFFFKLIIWNIDIHTCLLDSTFLWPHLPSGNTCKL